MYCFDYLSDRMREKTIEDVSGNFFSDRPLTVRAYDHAVIASKKQGGPGVFTDAGYISDSDVHNGFSQIAGSKLHGMIPERQEEVVYIGTFLDIWGHCLTDNLKHLWFLEDERFSGLRELRYIYTIVNEEKGVPSGFETLLKLLGIPQNRLTLVTGKEKFSRVWLPDPCFFCEDVPYKRGRPLPRYYTKQYRDVIDKIIKSTEMRPGLEKVYFTRTGWTRSAKQKNRDFGEERIEKVFANAGYKIIAPETISVEDQISLLHGAKCFASTLGSTSLNAVFCKPETEICIINKQNMNFGYQLAINQFCGGNITIIDANRSSMNSRTRPWKGPFFMYASKELCRWAGQKQELFPFSDYINYLTVSVFMMSYRKFKNEFKRVGRLLKSVQNNQSENR